MQATFGIVDDVALHVHLFEACGRGVHHIRLNMALSLRSLASIEKVVLLWLLLTLPKAILRFRCVDLLLKFFLLVHVAIFDVLEIEDGLFYLICGFLTIFGRFS